MNLEQFFSMGGYAFYVWTSYGIAFVVLILNLLLPLRRKAAVLKDIERALKVEDAKQQRARP
ncbi:MAG: heme exporter protein CcmD [Candidatus Methylumidiphilus sp.]